MQSTIAKPIYPTRAIVGEGSLWDHDNQRLLWVDILDHKIFAFDPLTGSNLGFDLGQDIGTVVITENGLWAYADENGLGFLDPVTGIKSKGPQPEMKNAHIRFNDGKCDPRGTLWAGTMAYSCEEGAGTLYEFNSLGEVRERISNVTISNGLVWNKSCTVFYYIDSTTYKVYKYDYDITTGSIQNRKTIATIDPSIGLPDGMAIDTEDHLWVAIFGGGRVIRIDPTTGNVVYEVRLPVPKVTSCAFGGKDLNQLFITTAAYEMDSDELLKYPYSGSLFVAELPFKGVLPYKLNYELGVKSN